MASKALRGRLFDPSLSSSLNSVCPSCRFAASIVRQNPRRHASFLGSNWRETARAANKHLDKYLKQAPDTPAVKQAPEPPASKQTVVDAERKESDGTDLVVRGLPSEESVFGGQDGSVVGQGAAADSAKPFEEIDPEALMNVLDPEPGKRLAWQRKKVIQQIRKRGELSKAEAIQRSERECVVSSAMFKTSTKKLVHLARQIAGKPIDEAIIQMQLSKKRVAQDIMKHLEYAKDLAVVSRGMGLGKAENRAGQPIEIETKDGRKRLITDQTGIYVDQAWVNKGEQNVTPDYRGRGRVFRLTHRRAKITVILKEEATRIRQWEEREAKLKNRKLWLHLPDRPITLQRQYPLW